MKPGERVAARVRSALLLLVFLVLAGCAGEEAPSVTPPPAVGTPSASASTSPATPTTTGPAERDTTVTVVVVRSTFERRLPNGSLWEPERPSIHGCPDAFAIDRGARTVTVDGANASREHADAKAAISVALRSPAAFYRNAELSLPEDLPHRVVLGPATPGGSGTETVELVLDDGGLRVDGDPLAAGSSATRDIRYAWNGTVNEDGRPVSVSLDVRESITIEHVGAWPDPIRGREPLLCL